MIQFNKIFIQLENQGYRPPLGVREGGSWRGPVVVLAEWGGVSLGDQAGQLSTASADSDRKVAKIAAGPEFWQKSKINKGASVNIEV